MSVSGRVFHTVLRVHALLYERTDGRVGHRMLGLPTLMLRTTGRRSGVDRTNALVYVRDGERYLVVPSNGGADRAPGWFHNLCAQPEVEIQIGRERCAATAAVVEPDVEDFARLWKIADDNNRGRYDAYQARTDRAIPVVALTPGN